MNIDFLLGSLHNRTLKKGRNKLIDSSLVLRMLLEYYRVEKLQRLRLIKELFYS